MDHINFVPSGRPTFGAEQEFFLVSDTQWPAPMAEAFLARAKLVSMADIWTYELSACQVEARTGIETDLPTLIRNMRGSFLGGQMIAGRNGFLAPVGCSLVAHSVAPENMPLDVYPDPEGRYQRMAKQVDESVLRAACRVTSVQLHIGGFRNFAALLAGYRRLVMKRQQIEEMTDRSGGERLRLYRSFANNPDPVLYHDQAHFCQVAEAQGWAGKPKDCHGLIRISRYGTIEIRCMDNTANYGELEQHFDQIVRWALDELGEQGLAA